MPFTLVAFHAHPDDESLLCGGTLARAAAEGHRVVLVAATDGAAGLASDRADLGQRRRAELDRAAEALGAAAVVHLGYADGSFSDAGLEEPARALLAVLERESADVVTGYDPSGGYGHPDHVHVHRVAREASRLASDLPLLEATVDRELLARAARIVNLLPGAPSIDLDRLASAYLPRSEITHRVDVRAYLPQKIAALTAHHSQQTGSRGVRTVTLLRRLPGPLARAVLGREWFREVGAPVPAIPRDDIFVACRPDPRLESP